MVKKKGLKRSIDQAADQTIGQATGRRHKRSKKILGLDLGSIGKVVATAVIAEIANTALSKATQPDQDETSPVADPGSADRPQAAPTPRKAEQAAQADSHDDQADHDDHTIDEPSLKSAAPKFASAARAEQTPTEDDQPGWVSPLLNGVQPVITEVAPLLGQTVAQSIAAIGQRVIRPEAVGEAAAQTATQTGAAMSQAGELSEQTLQTINTAVQKALEQALSGLGTAKQAVADHLPLGDQTDEAAPTKKKGKKAKGKKQGKKAKGKKK